SGTESRPVLLCMGLFSIFSIRAPRWTANLAASAEHPVHQPAIQSGGGFGPRRWIWRRRGGARRRRAIAATRWKRRDGGRGLRGWLIRRLRVGADLRCRLEQI